jgi:hypothetical protein
VGTEVDRAYLDKRQLAAKGVDAEGKGHDLDQRPSERAHDDKCNLVRALRDLTDGDAGGAQEPVGPDELCEALTASLAFVTVGASFYEAARRVEWTVDTSGVRWAQAVSASAEASPNGSV